MKYAVKITTGFLGIPMTKFAGLRSGCKSRKDKVDGWKKKSSAEKYIEKHQMFDSMFGDMLDKEYEIIVIYGA